MMNETIQQLTRMLLDGNQNAAVRMIENRTEPAPELFDTLLAPALQHVGVLWEENEITVADEHIATATMDIVLTRLFPYQGGAGRPGKKVMLLCLEGEQHYIGLKMAGAIFVMNGYESLFYGPNVPTEAALTKAVESEIDVVAVSSTIIYHTPELKRYREAFESLEKKPVLMVGGRMTNLYDLSPYGAEDTVFMPNCTALHEWLQQTAVKEADHAN